MVKEEFKENRVFKYPEEYDVIDQGEENKRHLKHKKVFGKDMVGDMMPEEARL